MLMTFFSAALRAADRPLPLGKQPTGTPPGEKRGEIRRVVLQDSDAACKWCAVSTARAERVRHRVARSEGDVSEPSAEQLCRPSRRRTGDGITGSRKTSMANAVLLTGRSRWSAKPCLDLDEEPVVEAVQASDHG